MKIRWERCDAFVLSWIRAAVAPKLMTSFVYASSSKKIWSGFKEKFDKSNLTRFFIVWLRRVKITRQTTKAVAVFGWAE